MTAVTIFKQTCNWPGTEQIKGMSDFLLLVDSKPQFTFLEWMCFTFKLPLHGRFGERITSKQDQIKIRDQVTKI